MSLVSVSRCQEGLWVGLITHPGVLPSVVCLCGRETSMMRRPWSTRAVEPWGGDPTSGFQNSHFVLHGSLIRILSKPGDPGICAKGLGKTTKNLMIANAPSHVRTVRNLYTNKPNFVS